jgi:NitT/TauT family transport system permease protein
MIAIRRFVLVTASLLWPMVIWYGIADATGLVSSHLLPPCAQVLKQLWHLNEHQYFGADFLFTLRRWLTGLTGGAVMGSLLGLVLGRFPRWYKFFEFSIEFTRAMPVTAIFPLFLLLFGIGDLSKVVMVAFPTCLLLLVNTAYGVLHASRGRIAMAELFGANQWQVFTEVIVYEALPQAFIGLRLASSLSLVVAVVSEMFIGTEFGLGQRIYDSYLVSNPVTLYTYLLVLGLLGYTSNKLILALEGRSVHWLGR